MAEFPDVLFREFIEHSAVAILVCQGDQVVYANARAAEILEASERNGWSLADLTPDPTRAGTFELFHSGLLNRDNWQPELMMKKKNSHHFIASLGVKNLTERGLTLISLQDVTIEKKLSREVQSKQAEIERAYGELIEQNRQLKELDLAKDRFIALTTHELRTPLSAIVATAEVLEMQLFESDAQRGEFIKTIGEQARHLMELVNDILDFAKIRAGKMEFYVEAVELQPVLEKLLGGFQHMAEASQVKLEVSTDRCPPQVWADLIRLKEVVNNCVSNAIKYNRRDGKVKIWAEEQTTPEGRRVARITVKDNGHGIPPERASSVFNEFETVGNVSRHHKGTGLGMPISRRLMEQMGGGLWFNSVVGEGTEFYIDIPLDQVLSEDVYRSRPDFDADLAA